ncbi:uncharacterized protein LOC115035148 [Acyrthosiphon pisum]|uniref:DUF4806 domain-containing protein n=1 Tax=Acyrthosiphon pisum TaxID=7029 RepID=A0A8R2JX65_ACYPI|nr:uncharacterized protein LOC115035148 [Acyrthosiphon pisum]
MSNGESKPQSTIRQKCSEHFILPAKSVAKVCDIEEKLQLSASRQLMISRLQQCGGRSQNDTTTLILRTLLTDHCASNYNFEGRNSGKHAFEDLIMFSIVLVVSVSVDYVVGDMTQSNTLNTKIETKNALIMGYHKKSSFRSLKSVLRFERLLLWWLVFMH